MSATRDMVSDTNPGQTLAPAQRTATVDGAAVDLAGSEAATVLVNVGNHTAGHFELVLQEADEDPENPGDPGTFAAVDAADILGTVHDVDEDHEDSEFVFGYRGTKRFIRVRAVREDAGDAVFGVAVLRQHLTRRPAVPLESDVL